MTSLLDFYRFRFGQAIKRQGNGWNGPCPLCGGTDRFTVFPAQAGGELCQKHGIDGPWACPRGCGKGGDVISWFMEVEGLSLAKSAPITRSPASGLAASAGPAATP